MPVSAAGNVSQPSCRQGSAPREEGRLHPATSLCSGSAGSNPMSTGCPFWRGKPLPFQAVISLSSLSSRCLGKAHPEGCAAGSAFRRDEMGMAMRTEREHPAQEQCPTVRVVATGKRRTPSRCPSTPQQRRDAARGRRLPLSSPLPGVRQSRGSGVAETWQEQQPPGRIYLCRSFHLKGGRITTKSYFPMNRLPLCYALKLIANEEMEIAYFDFF